MLSTVRVTEERHPGGLCQDTLGKDKCQMLPGPDHRVLERRWILWVWRWTNEKGDCWVVWNYLKGTAKSGELFSCPRIWQEPAFPAQAALRWGASKVSWRCSSPFQATPQTTCFMGTKGNGTQHEAVPGTVSHHCGVLDSPPGSLAVVSVKTGRGQRASYVIWLCLYSKLFLLLRCYICSALINCFLRITNSQVLWPFSTGRDLWDF